MLSPQLASHASHLARSQRLMWAALTAALGIWALLPFQLEAVAARATPALLGPLLAAAAATAGLASLLLHRRTHAPERLRARIPTGTAGAARECAVVQGLQGLVAPWVACLALNESIAIFGLVLALLRGEPAHGLPFAAAALGLNLAMFPRPALFAERALAGSGL